MELNKRLEKAVKNGNSKQIEACFNEIYDNYIQLVYIIISKYIKVKEDKEELANDVFINFFNHLENIDFTKNIKYYLATTSKNVAINYLKKNNLNDLNISFDENIDYFQSVDNGNYYELIESWKSFLKDEEIQIVLMHVLEGYELKEIATKLNKSPNTIKSIYRRTILKIKKWRKN